jgi:hypothetical protein
MRWTGHVDFMGKIRNACRHLVVGVKGEGLRYLWKIHNRARAEHFECDKETSLSVKMWGNFLKT